MASLPRRIEPFGQRQRIAGMLGLHSYRVPRAGGKVTFSARGPIGKPDDRRTRRRAVVRDSKIDGKSAG
ncbi:hypothetical protein V0288_23905 [Pannus brasiliensis CCIBt3594]|uniref:Uncharacterized protein n=1 Tax=Pannus brasiliensis CCIBt3594 TaxID=1427578 RepID=A0AAW9QTE2_9CHRO